MQPLRWPTHDELFPPERGDWECIGPIGRLIYLWRWGDKDGRQHDFISEQLRSRPAIDPLEWGDDLVRQHVALVVCEEMHREFHWPNANFLPNDPLMLVCTRLNPGREFFIAYIEAQRRLGLPFGGRETFFRLPPQPFEQVPLSAVVDSFLGHVLRLKASTASHPPASSVQ